MTGTMPWALWALSAGLGSAVAAFTETEQPRVERSVLPMATVSYDADDGLGAGAQMEVAIRDGLRTPFRGLWSFKTYATLGGYRNHQVRWDRVGWGAEQRFRTGLELGYRRRNSLGYWGMGGDTVRHEISSWHRWGQSLPHARLAIRRRVAESHWSTYTVLNPKWVRVTALDDSMLAKESPYGMAGGFGLPITLGVFRDTRDHEIVPRSGTVWETSIRAAADLDGEAGGFWGFMSAVRAYGSVGQLTLAGRLMGEWLQGFPGDVPFYELTEWGTLEVVESFGGHQTLRGVPMGRWRGPGKVIANLELRLHTLTHTLLGQNVNWQIAAFGDAGAIVDESIAQGDTPTVHPAVGLGLRPILDNTLCGRVDVGVGWDALEGSTGEARSVPNVALYVNVGQAF